MLTILDNKNELWFTTGSVFLANFTPGNYKVDDARPPPIYRPNEGCPNLNAAFSDLEANAG
ncbi:hypothetical protein N7448_002245 [Penicillium atrosanguineum]|uniref:Uncharacterized protein n=1 Tax=Penicillium atrosanguineum TaxID=1132637 RepID=A0A9W9HDQ9_9EURO|nr:uncharacterized protein N7443_005647 [Penicillium atrosanguineum]KAJ5128525.1 hypothetical protein N7526_006691 [Penicillium atrosanguineum]KAJ5144853.1 hypothetical protein N7448_002245 [Penicillium atrosanguineum]KAJ5300645.1 hypothetical protein N7443_005647 [Penicillium atrosanguineum]KAJ5311287.1 hypothetical protein N7476_007147 [Penicillium atrosanguineum]